MIEFVLFGFIFLFIIVGYIAKEKDEGAESFHLANRRLNRWLVGISAGATANSGFIVVGAVGMGYMMGLSSLLYPLAWFFGDLIFWYFFASKIRQLDAVKESFTVSEVLTFYNNDKILKILSATIIVTLITIYASSQLIASTKIVSSFSEISNSLAIFLSFVFVIAYTIWGGFKSSVYTDVLQGIMMLLLTLGVLWWGIEEVGGIASFFQSIEKVSDSYASILGENSSYAILSIILGMSFASLGFSLSQPQVITRVFAAKDENEIKAARWIYISFLHFTWIGMSLIGIIARILMPELQDAEVALPALAKENFNNLVIGFIFAAMVATVLSSVDSMLVSVASSLSLDFGVEKRVGLNSKITHRLIILMIGLVALVFALFLKSTVFSIVLFAVSIMSASIGVAILMLTLGISNNSKTLKITIIVGLITSIVWRVFELQQLISETFIGMLFAFLAGIIYEQYRKRMPNSRL